MPRQVAPPSHEQIEKLMRPRRDWSSIQVGILTGLAVLSAAYTAEWIAGSNPYLYLALYVAFCAPVVRLGLTVARKMGRGQAALIQERRRTSDRITNVSTALTAGLQAGRVDEKGNAHFSSW